MIYSKEMMETYSFLFEIKLPKRVNPQMMIKLKEKLDASGYECEISKKFIKIIIQLTSGPFLGIMEQHRIYIIGQGLLDEIEAFGLLRKKVKIKSIKVLDDGIYREFCLMSMVCDEP